MTVRSYLRATRSGRWCSCRCTSATSASSRARPTSASCPASRRRRRSSSDCCAAVRRLRERFGRVHVNIGEPIRLDALLDAARAGLAARDARGAGTAALGQCRWSTSWRGTIMRNINAAAAVTPVNLLALALLATPRQAMLEADLRASSTRCWRCCGRMPYSERVTLTDRAPADIIDYAASSCKLIVAREPSRSASSCACARGMPCSRPTTATTCCTWWRCRRCSPAASSATPSCAPTTSSAWPGASIPTSPQELFLRWTEAELPGGRRAAAGGAGGARPAAAGAGAGHLAPAGAELGGGDAAVAAGAGHAADHRALLPGHRAAGARRQRPGHPEEARGALPA